MEKICARHRAGGVLCHAGAHIEGVRSEPIMRSGHSTQGGPETIAAVRRILREHNGER